MYTLRLVWYPDQYFVFAVNWRENVMWRTISRDDIRNTVPEEGRRAKIFEREVLVAGFPVIGDIVANLCCTSHGD